MVKLNLLVFGFILLTANVFCQKDTLKIKPIEKNNILSEVEVNNSKTRITQKPINVSIIEAKPFYNTNVSGLDLLKQVSGIKIRQDGGFGSKTEISINGSTGKQIKYFIDGLPQDNLGETQLLNIYPVEQMERIEVYKGVLPVDLGADALGAAINIVTRKDKENFYDTSYSIASFNTNRFNFSAKKYITEKYYAGIQLNANYAQNNYNIDAEVPNQFGNNEVKNVKRFHDVFKNYNLKLQFGLTDMKFADQLNISFIQTGTYDEIQNNLTQTQPYGEAFYKENLWSTIVKYQKNNLFNKFNLNAMASFNRVDGLFTDTSLNVYNWEGKVVDQRFSGDEITSSGNLLNIYTNVLNGKITGTYNIKVNLKFIFSNTLQNFNRTGKDIVAQKFYGGIDYFGTPSSMTKNIAGIGFEGNFFDTKLKFSSAIKNYSSSLSGYIIEFTKQIIIEQKLNASAYNFAISYNVGSRTQIKVAYERAARLPEVEEAFGDLILIKANPKINIEKSDNISLNFLHNSNKIETELTSFYRNVDNIIYLRTSQFSGHYQNLLSAKVLGAEANIKYSPADFINFNANVTY